MKLLLLSSLLIIQCCLALAQSDALNRHSQNDSSRFGPRGYPGMVITEGVWGVNKAYFTNTNWFSNNKDSAFFKADTIRLVKYSNLAPDFQTRGKKEYAEWETKYLGHGDFVQIGLNRHKELHFTEMHSNSMSNVWGEPLTWLFDENTILLKLFDTKHKVISSFQPVSKKQMHIESRFSEQKDLLTTELTLVRVK
jgi:hypothetical protein